MEDNQRYREHGFADREEYLENLADQFGMDIRDVSAVADLLGPNEDFDGLVTTLEDFA